MASSFFPSHFFSFPFPKHTLRNDTLNLIVASSSPNTNTLNKTANDNPPPVPLKNKLNKQGNSVWFKPSDVAQDDKIKSRKKKNRVKADVEHPQVKMRVGLDMCSKRGDVIGAIDFYDSALSDDNVKLDQYHFTVLLYLCSSAAVGLVRPAKSGSTARTTLDSSPEGAMWFSNGFVKRNSRALDNLNNNDNASNNNNNEIIRVGEDVRKYALERGFEIYDKMREDAVAMNEAALTSVARMAMAMGDGGMAFAMVKEMKRMGINPRLRSYGPALSAFCGSGEIEKAFDVERHMLENGVYPEEPELEALLRVSVGARKGDKVYYMLHKLRTSVRRVSPSTAELIVKWFESKEASRVGKTKYDERLIREAMENGGGGWHGQGWLGKGKWLVLRTTIGSDGLCKCCGGKLATIDLDPVETENFAESVASIAIKRERNSSFQKFRKWLDYFGPFEAVVDAANVGLFSQKKFIPSKVNAVVNGISQKLPSKRWPLIVLHNRRLIGGRMDERVNKALVEKWQTADALYATPTGSNDDWYWLYAAIKFKCLLVTNDEMRDHTFQLLGNDFFPRWKERHQVHFSFSEGGPVFHMPPPCSVVIQESEEGHWHIPVESEHGYEAERTWLCIMRSKFHEATNDSATRPKDEKSPHGNKSVSTSTMRTSIQSESLTTTDHKYSNDRPQEILKSLKDILSGSASSNHRSILPEIETAENIGGCTIDFQI